MVVMVGVLQQQLDLMLEQELGAYMLSHKHKSERVTLRTVGGF